MRVERAADIYPTVRRAFSLARRGAPGPVAVEIPANLFMLVQEVEELHFAPDPDPARLPDRELVERAARMLGEAAHPAIYVGAGAAGAADLAVFDVSGRQVRQLVRGQLPAGEHVTVWDGTGDDGRPARAGVYFTRLKVGGALLSRRVVFVR